MMIRLLSTPVLVLALALNLQAGEPTPEEANSIAELDGGWITEIEVASELPHKGVKNLKYAFRAGWESLIEEAFQKELRSEKLLHLTLPEESTPTPTPDGTLLENPIRLRVVLTDNLTRGKDNTNLDSIESWANAQLSARIEFFLPGEDVPHATDLLEADYESRSNGPLNAELFRRAYFICFQRLAVRASGKASRRLRLEQYEQTPKSKFAPFRPFRPR